MTPRENRERLLSRRAGQSVEARQQVAVASANTPWLGRCRFCGFTTQATLAMLYKEGCVECGAKPERKSHASNNSSP